MDDSQAGPSDRPPRRSGDGKASIQSLAHVAVLVDDYDRAIAYYTGTLGFDLLQDVHQGDKRWVSVAPPGARECSLVLARASNPSQHARIGDQTGGRVFLFLRTDDFWRDYDALRERGVTFTEKPREESYGIVAVFVDLYGNRWDLLQAQ